MLDIPQTTVPPSESIQPTIQTQLSQQPLSQPEPERKFISKKTIGVKIIQISNLSLGIIQLIIAISLLISLDKYTFEFFLYHSLLTIAFLSSAAGFFVFNKLAIKLGYGSQILILVFLLASIFIGPFSRFINHFSSVSNFLGVYTSTWVGFEATGIVLTFFLSLLILFVMTVGSILLFIQSLKRLNSS